MASAGPANTTVTANGAVPTEIEATSSASVIIPLLIFRGEVDQLRVDNVPGAGLPQLRPLSSHQQLVAVAGVGDRLANKIFPGESIVTVHVDPLDPLPGPPLAWQALDALIIDGPWPGSLDPHKLPALLAGGTEIAVRSPERPDTFLPWESIDGGWVLRPEILGPIGCDGNDAAYAPAIAWHPDLASPTRTQIVLAGSLFSLAALGCLLLPRQFVLPGVAVATMVSVVSIGVWQKKKMPAVFRAVGSVAVDGRPLLQADRWQFVTSRQSTPATCDCIGESWPLFADPAQAVNFNMSLRWEGDAGRFHFDLPAEGKLAVVSRTLQPSRATSATGITSDTDSPMAALARSLYAQPRQRMTVGPGPPWNASDPAPEWPPIHLRSE